MKTLRMVIESIHLDRVQSEPLVLPEVPVNQVRLDSRQVGKNDIFVAFTGEHVDGHRFIPNAIENGAVLVVGTQPLKNQSVPYVRVRDARFALAQIAAALEDFPARKLTVIGVTGTDGKTTTSNLIFQILRSAGIRAGLISTVNAVVGDQVLDTGFHVTTPEAPDVQRYLAMMVEAGLTHVVLESTSHGLAQNRVAMCEYDLAVVTNITHEHLDYHGSYQAYAEAKARLFTGLDQTAKKAQGNVRLGVLNHDDQSFDYLQSVSTGRNVSYGLCPGKSDYWAEEIQYDASGVAFAIAHGETRTPIQSHLVGDYNISNILAAFCAAVEGLGIAPRVAARGINELESVPGRMEFFDFGQNFAAIVDFAHTPNALYRALGAVRQMTDGKLWCVFGSAGLRDREKRAMMAEVSAELADRSILTAEDPRTESLRGILEEMARAAEGKGAVEGQTYWRIPDRGAAIQFAVDHAEPGDVVIACGKGHEQSMCFGTTEYLWDDRIAMRVALRKRLGIEHEEQLPYLPTQDKDVG
ncbi:MAG: UDP-N-acetylmuramoyl-L-alanyl-D-glutamate--2,6-diaminopimelate ligase [Anaerolineaceae bacterium]|nr:UDP-N-acetylmuramoyl-L-alanyl-D-glutamate--2,6-diaminopimelate ligase [Anaerolineaceae bacterium]